LKLDIDWDTWFNGLWLPPYDPTPDLDATIFNKCVELSDKWKKHGGEGAKKADIEGPNWDAMMTMVFLDDLLNTFVPVPHPLLEKMDATYQFAHTNNPEIAYRWLWLSLQSDFVGDRLVDSVDTFLSRNGRGIYVKPLYRELIRLGDKGALSKERVKGIYKKHRTFYHSVIRNTFDSQLQ